MNTQREIELIYREAAASVRTIFDIVSRDQGIKGVLELDVDEVVNDQIEANIKMLKQVKEMYLC